MNLILQPKARAYVYNGEWVADCPRAGCANVEFLFGPERPGVPGSPRTVRKTQYYCTYCQHLAEIDWPKNEAEIMEILNKRPIPNTRNWYPKDHDVAIRARIPHGQSIADLIEENHENGVA